MSRLILCLLGVLAVHASAFAETIACLGRIEPFDGVRALAGPSGVRGGSTVIAELRVEEGDWAELGQVLAVLDDYNLRRAEVDRQKELLEEANVRLQRLESLSTTQATSRAKLDEARYQVSTLNAEMAVYRARLDMSLIRAPQRGQVLKIYARPGEKVGPEGVLELGETDRMTVIAEVYETDISRVRVGQTATVSNPAFEQPLAGEVVKIGWRVGKMDVLSSDPVADTDARVVETTILMQESEPIQKLTNMQVEVEIRL